MPMFEDDKSFFDNYVTLFVNNWKFYCAEFQKEINVISKPFSDATNKAYPKLLDLYGDIVKNDTSDFDVSGTYIIGDFVFMLFYEVKKGTEDHEVAFFMFDKKGIPLAMLVDSAKYKVHQNGWISNCFEVPRNQRNIEEFLYSKIVGVIMFRMFKTFAEVETKFLKPKSRVKDIACKYVNDTDLKLNYLDSKWFTNLVKSEGFTVRGHFRLQPKKVNGEWTRELIWISDFQKSGYTAPARITF